MPLKTEDDIAEIFGRVFNGQTNIMTPDVIYYGQAGDHIYEVSSGNGIFKGEVIWGLTVLTSEGLRTNLSRPFESYNELKRYIRTLKWQGER